LERELEGANSLVTGSSHGIGREVALALAGRLVTSHHVG
jgi:NAD(P)-dependent dehydrogenase (short-subunit alcohol dehydrogenase family)